MRLSSQTIRRLSLDDGMIVPFSERAVSHGRTFGLSSAGYDVRIREHIVLLPRAFRLASTLETFRLPNDVAMDIKDKSSNIRLGFQVHNTVAEPGWQGVLTLELSNLTDEVIEILAGTPIAQCVFEALDEPTDQPYRGRYQNQAAGPQPATLLPDDWEGLA